MFDHQFSSAETLFWSTADILTLSSLKVIGLVIIFGRSLTSLPSSREFKSAGHASSHSMMPMAASDGLLTIASGNVEQYGPPRITKASVTASLIDLSASMYCVWLPVIADAATI